jgi:hypothetical protein
MYNYNAHSVMELRDFARSAAITYANVRKLALVVALQAWDVDHAPQVAAQLSPVARQARRANARAAKTSKVATQPSSPTKPQRKRKQPASVADSDQTSKRQKTIESTSNDATGWVPSLASQVIEHEENLDLTRASGGQIHKSLTSRAAIFRRIALSAASATGLLSPSHCVSRHVRVQPMQ